MIFTISFSHKMMNTLLIRTVVYSCVGPQKSDIMCLAHNEQWLEWARWCAHFCGYFVYKIINNFSAILRIGICKFGNGFLKLFFQLLIFGQNRYYPCFIYWASQGIWKSIQHRMTRSFVVSQCFIVLNAITVFSK